jgi:hypothetical protein
MKSLAKNPDERFQTMEDFRRGLLGEVPVTAPGSRRADGPRPLGSGAAPVQTLSPQSPQSTTLSAASSEIEDELVSPRRRTGLVVGALGAVAVAAVIALVAFPKHGTTEAASPPPVPTPSAPPKAPAAPPTVTIRFEAQPHGVHVFRKSDDKDLGAAPLEVKLPKDSDATEYVLRKSGYKDAALAADLSADHTLHAKLDAVPSPPPEAPAAPTPTADASASKKKSSPARKPTTRKGRGPAPDEDGLATPSF